MIHREPRAFLLCEPSRSVPLTPLWLWWVKILLRMTPGFSQMKQGICIFPRISTNSLVHRQNVLIHMPYTVWNFIKQPFELTFPGHTCNLEHGLYISTRVLWGQFPCPAMHGVSLHHAHVVESTLISLLRAGQILQALWSLTQRS